MVRTWFFWPNEKKNPSPSVCLRVCRCVLYLFFFQMHLLELQMNFTSYITPTSFSLSLSRSSVYSKSDRFSDCAVRLQLTWHPWALAAGGWRGEDLHKVRSQRLVEGRGQRQGEWQPRDADKPNRNRITIVTEQTWDFKSSEKMISLWWM